MDLIQIKIKIFFFELLIIFLQTKLFQFYFENHDIKFKNKINENKMNIIVSLTTSKENIQSLLVDNLIKSLLNQTILPYKILLSINNKDLIYISHFLKLLIKNNTIEVIFAKKDWKYLNRYYYIPDKYKTFVVIVVDDNIILEKTAIENLFKSYILNPNAISARRVCKMNFDNRWNLKPFNFWYKDYKYEINPKFYLFAIHGAGTLFPPNTLNLKEDFLFYFKKFINAHDFIIKYFELKENLKTIYVDNTNKYSPLNINLFEKYNKLLKISLNEHQLKEDFGKKYKIEIYKNIIKEKVVIPNKVKEHFLNTINNNTITKDTLLVSMTSYPSRIFGIYEVFISLLYQSADISSYQCFLTLAKEEFINGEKELPLEVQKLINNRWIKLIWYHNIYSHKKLMPILQNFPENDILIVDDNIIRTKNFIEIFQNDHKIYPKDILCGTFMYYFDNNIEIRKFHGYKGKKTGEFNSVPNIIFQTAKPANGVGGILFPKHTFSDKRFFNETLYMNVCPNSDELWQYAFNIIENKILRQTSIIIDNSLNIVEGNQKTDTNLYKNNKNKYSVINEKIINIFPEFKINSIERLKKIIVSLTSYKQRFKNLQFVFQSIYNNTMKPFKIVLTIYKEDLNFLPKNLKDMINEKKIELIVTDIDLKSHKKYFEVMKKYRDYAIITIDDDIIYTNDLIETLYNSYIKYPNCIHSRRVHKITIKNNEILPYNKWIKEYKNELNPSFNLLANTGSGTLFPPNILNINDENIKEIINCITADDIYLKYLSRKKNIKIVWVPNDYLLGIKQLNDKYALYIKNALVGNLNDICLKVFNVI